MGRRLPNRIQTRSRVMDVFYRTHLKGLDNSVGVYSLVKLRETETTAQTSMPPYVYEILEDVAGHLGRIDTTLATYSRVWSLYRMSETDLAIVRMATWEILFNPDVDEPVATTTTAQLAAECSIDESPKSINGLLGTISDMRKASVTQDTPRADSDVDAETPGPVRTPVDFGVVVKAVQGYTHQEGGVLFQIDLESLE